MAAAWGLPDTPAYFVHSELELGGEQGHSVLKEAFALAAGGWGFLLPLQGKTCLRVLSIHLVPRMLTASTSAAGCKNAQAGA